MSAGSDADELVEAVVGGASGDAGVGEAALDVEDFEFFSGEEAAALVVEGDAGVDGVVGGGDAQASGAVEALGFVAGLFEFEGDGAGGFVGALGAEGADDGGRGEGDDDGDDDEDDHQLDEGETSAMYGGVGVGHGGVGSGDVVAARGGQRGRCAKIRPRAQSVQDEGWAKKMCVCVGFLGLGGAHFLRALQLFAGWRGGGFVCGEGVLTVLGGSGTTTQSWAVASLAIHAGPSSLGD